MLMASSWSCVTCTNVMPTSCWMRLSSICSCLRRRRSSAPSGSSSSSARGRLTSARASATRCCWPPESWPGLRLPRWPSWTSSSASATRLRTSSLATFLPLEPERDVLLDAQVREERVGLEDRVDVALVRRVLGDVVAAEEDAAVGRVLEAADHAQRRGLAAAGRAEQRVERAARDLEVERVDRGHVAEALRHPLEADVRLRRSTRPATLQNAQSRSPSWTTTYRSSRFAAMASWRGGRAEGPEGGRARVRLERRDRRRLDRARLLARRGAHARRGRRRRCRRRRS